MKFMAVVMLALVSVTLFIYLLLFFQIFFFIIREEQCPYRAQ